MATSIARTMKAVVTDGKGWFRINNEHKVPNVQPGTALIKVKSLALNPTDWKSGIRKTTPNLIVGCDVAGEVVSVGDGVTNVKVGDRISTFARGSWSEEMGGFAEYSLVETDIVWKVPEKISWEEAAALAGIGPHTVWQAFYLLLDLPTPLNPASTPTPLLIWSGATSVGMYAIQFARASGFLPITTASPKHHEYLKAIGAEEVFDYRDEKAPEKIKAKYPGIKYGLDCISEKGSSKLATLAMEEGTLVTLLPVKKDETFNQKVEVTLTLLYSAIGKPYASIVNGEIQPARPNERAALAEWDANVWPKLVGNGVIKSNPLRKGQGLDGVIDGLTYLKEGKASGEKLVYSV